VENLAGLTAPAHFAWNGKRVLCTGATGIVGSALVRQLLKRGAEVVAFIRDADARSDFYRSGAYRFVTSVNGTLEDFASVERAINEHQVDTVIHLGAQPIVETALRYPLQSFEANIRGTYNVLDACRQHGGLVRRVVVASSDKAYGDHAGQAYDENQPLTANNPYDVSKACGDMLAQTYAHTYELPVLIARCGNIYGGGDLNWNRIVPGTVRSLFQDEPPVIRSDGTYVRDYIYVGDAASAYVALAERAGDDELRGQAFNFSAEAPCSVLDLVAVISRLMGKEHLQPVILNQARNEIPAQRVSAAKARQTLGWTPEFDLTTGLRATIDWYQEFLEEARCAQAHF
jgi:CDP-glucose 4,6-dehydratase